MKFDTVAVIAVGIGAYILWANRAPESTMALGETSRPGDPGYTDTGVIGHQSDPSNSDHELVTFPGTMGDSTAAAARARNLLRARGVGVGNVLDSETGAVIRIPVGDPVQYDYGHPVDPWDVTIRTPAGTGRRPASPIDVEPHDVTLPFKPHEVPVDVPSNSEHDPYSRVSLPPMRDPNWGQA